MLVLLLALCFRFAILGDRTGGADQAVYEQIWRSIEREHPAFVINVGDTVESLDDWAVLRPFFRKYPMYFTPGNHDIWSAESERVYEKETKRPPFYSFDYQNAHFTVLDNSRTEDLSPQQLAFLEADLRANAGRHPKLVFFHRPFWLLPLKLGSGDFELHRLATKYGVTAVVSGHGHQYVRIERDGVIYLEVGSSGGSLARGLNSGQGKKEGWFYQYVMGEIKDGLLTLQVREPRP